jgi:hypothetical protein
MFKACLRSLELVFGLGRVNSSEHFLLHAVFNGVDAFCEPFLVLLDSVLVDELDGVEIAVEERGLVEILERDFSQLGSFLVEHVDEGHVIPRTFATEFNPVSMVFYGTLHGRSGLERHASFQLDSKCFDETWTQGRRGGFTVEGHVLV